MTALRALLKHRSAKVAVTGILSVAALAPTTAMAATSGHSTQATPHTSAVNLHAASVKAGSHTGTVKVALAADTKSKPAAKAPAQAAPKDVYGKSAMSQLIPTSTSGSQSTFTLNSAQLANAHAIVQTAYKMHLPVRAAVIAVATSMQESKLENLTVAVDHDSVGLFQQRPSAGWGTAAECSNPTHAASKFLSALAQVSNWQHKQLWDDAQTVQGSAYPYRYAQWEQHAAQVVQFVSQTS